MKEQDFERFKEKSKLILKNIKELGEINFEIVEEPKPDQPTYYITFKNNKSKGLKRWKMGIWATGKWSEYYGEDEYNEITVFLIHDWHLNKWRPSDSDISWSFIDSTTYFGNLIQDLKEIKENPIKAYGDVFYTTTDYSSLLYFKEWFHNVISTPLTYKLKNVWCPWVLFSTLFIISLVDKRVKKVQWFDISFGCNIYTFSFLASLKCSSDDLSFWKFYKLYSLWPSKLNRITGGWFNANWNVSDYYWGIRESDLRTRMLRGIIANDPNN